MQCIYDGNGGQICYSIKYTDDIGGVPSVTLDLVLMD